MARTATLFGGPRRRAQPRRLIALALMIVARLASPVCAYAQQDQNGPTVGDCLKPFPNQNAFRGFQAYEENDSFRGGDEKYTQGIRLVFLLNERSVPCKLQSFANNVGHWLSRNSTNNRYLSSWAVLIGQNLYTPKSITSRIVDLNDRGFAVYNHVGVSLVLTDKDEQSQHSFEATFGGLGPPDLGRGAQGGLHVLKLHRIPKGWDSADHSRIAGYGRYDYDRRIFCSASTDNCPFDFFLGGSLDAGNVRTGAAIRTAIRFGYNLQGFPSKPIGGTARLIPDSPQVKNRPSISWPSGLWGGVIWQSEGRFVPSTGLVVEAAPNQDFHRIRAVGDSRGGIEGGLRGFQVAAFWVTRSAEFRIADVPTRKQNFDSISFGYQGPVEFDPSSPALKRWFVAGWQSELGMGGVGGKSRVDLPPAHGLAGHTAIRKEIARGVFVGYDYNATTVEGAPTPGEPGNRSDIILAQQSVTAGWSRSSAWGQIGGRLGVDTRARARVETIFHPLLGIDVQEQRIDREFPTKRGGWLVGVQYMLPLAPMLTIGVDTTFHHVSLGNPVPGLNDPNYFAWTIGFQLRTPPLRQILARN